jgi:toxin-antitoxin system PIN domain toxin
MILPDVNVLIFACRVGAPEHPSHAAWLSRIVGSDESFAISPQVLGSVIRIMTHRATFGRSYALSDALRFCNALTSRPNCKIVQPGPMHWEIFCELCHKSSAHGNLVQDAWFAALAIERDCEWITHDTDYGRFPGLRWRPPF